MDACERKKFPLQRAKRAGEADRWNFRSRIGACYRSPRWMIFAVHQFWRLGPERFGGHAASLTARCDIIWVRGLPVQAQPTLRPC
jgi:hypothetical protein